MPHGKTIRILLDDGTVTGVRYAEIVNWTGQALVCPRSRISELKDWPESEKPGIYLLLGTSEEADREMAYIGESENGLSRITRHLYEKDFWREVILFTSKDLNLTKTHVKYLEARIYQLARIAGRYGLDNGNEPQKPVLPRGDEHAMEEFIDNIRLLLGALGHHRLLEPITARQSMTDLPPTRTDNSIQQPTPVLTLEKNNELLYLRTGNTEAKGLRTYEGFVVFKGSKGSWEETPAMKDRYKKIREQLISNDVIVSSDGSFVFSRDHLFNSPTEAAIILTGTSMSGPKYWKTSSGISLNEIEQAVSDSIVKDSE